MQLTHDCECAEVPVTGWAGKSRNDSGPSDEDDESVGIPRASSHPLPARIESPPLARLQANALDDDELTDIARYFGNR